MKTGLVGAVLRVASIAAVPFAAVVISAPAGAQGSGQRELFDWRGNVDQEVRVQMQGGRASVIAMGPREETGYDRARTLSGVPEVNGYVTVQMRQGRGRADVVQQPDAQNGYTTIVRIRDTQSGAGSYDVAAFWQPDGGYGYNNSGQYGQYGRYGRYGQYGDNGKYGNYGQYGQYGQYGYPAPVVVQRPVYGGRGVEGGKTLPSVSRGNVQPSGAAYPGQYPGQYPSQYPGRRPDDDRHDNGRDNGRYQRGAGRTAKQLPQANQSTQPGKTLPGTDRAYQQRGH